ncbi:MarR family transcriptional regulator [Rhodothalassium salexigens]|uniref:MarR family winged helix-turn-helix transcriptional regulator n=1 Tax=Rhodothalassium salexigens TaxID=1086 RepID=UPI001911DF11|nr:MarR family transcriptional regulator [Rhodothalassium salexigens]MBK5912552.1 MarR family transcriptional regulator [Rhodothalassium salexigens]MBK5920821.1 MarR family transcriptional regulator [Rhodothalassium salexigens]
MATNEAEMQEKLGGAPQSKQALRLWLRLLTCTTLIENRIRNQLRAEFDTTLPRFDVLAALDRYPDGLTMGELSRCLMVSNGNVTGVVNRLVTDGLVSRTASPADRRTHFVRLTDKGQEDFKRMAEVHHGWVESMFSGIDAADADQLYNELEQLKRSVFAFDEKSET